MYQQNLKEKNYNNNKTELNKCKRNTRDTILPSIKHYLRDTYNKHMKNAPKNNYRAISLLHLKGTSLQVTLQYINMVYAHRQN